MAKKFGGFPGGMGGGNMNNMIKQAQKMQQELEEQEIEATAGGGMVTVKVTGKKVITSISIKPEAVDPDDVEMLEDLIMVAVNDALSKVDSETQSQMSKITGGMNIPGLF